jgi:uncharacterized protein YdeI (BOF family)
MLRPGPLVASALGAVALAFGAQAAPTVDPYLQPDETWISLSGTVTAVSADSFALDYGPGTVTVEMDDGDRDADAYQLIRGDKVTVNGRIDDDFFETTTIEASSVYVEKLGTYFHASPIDDEDRSWAIVPSRVVVAETVVQGTVTAVREDAFVMNDGVRSLTVSVEAMPYDPLDDEGYQKIRVGDVVRASGTMGIDFFEGRQLKADGVIKLSG